MSEFIIEFIEVESVSLIFRAFEDHNVVTHEIFEKSVNSNEMGQQGDQKSAVSSKRFIHAFNEAPNESECELANEREVVISQPRCSLHSHTQIDFFSG